MSNPKGGDKRTRALTHAKRRARLRTKLRAQGVAEDLIEAKIADLRDAQRAQRERDFPELTALAKEIDERGMYRRLSPPDSGYRPVQRDKLLEGVGRATGMTAKAVRREKGMTKWEYEQATKSADRGIHEV